MNSTKLKNILFSVLWLVSSFVHTGSCAEEPPIPPARLEIEDPLEPLNRFIFDINLGLDDVFIEPAVLVYQTMFPPVFRECLHDALVNLRQPFIFVNCALQADAEKAGTVLLRFLVNSVFGFLGLFDVATEAGLPIIQEDFGKTLKMIGVEVGPYLVLPLLGPSSFRDGAGLAGGFLIDPINIIAIHQHKPALFWGYWGVDLFDARSQHEKTYAELKKTSLDLYATMRSLYDQKRGDGPADLEDTPKPSDED